MKIFYALLVLYSVVIVGLVISIWSVFAKAKQPGWASLVPIYNVLIMCKIAGKPNWTVLMWFVPFANFYFAVTTYHGISKRFGCGVGMTLGLLFLPFIFWPVLAFGDYEYAELNSPDPNSIAA